MDAAAETCRTELAFHAACGSRGAPEPAFSDSRSDLPDGFTVFALPEHHFGRMRTTNMVEQQNREIKQRTRVPGLFPNEAFQLRLVCAILTEVSEEWESADKAYLRMKVE